jgi:NAD(P)-dependent dehydrogenase (short-subunit alcohol dehydrogenase family)
MSDQSKQTDISETDKKEFQKELDHPVIAESYRGSDKLKDKVAIITGGDSGIGRSVAVYFAREGADVAIAYLESDEDASITRGLVEKEGRKCLLFRGDVSNQAFCSEVVAQVAKEWKKINILVNNAGTQEPAKDIEQISNEQLIRTFSVNIFPYFYFVQEAQPYMKEGDCIINTASVTAYRGSWHLLDYSATKGAIVAFTRSLAKNLASDKIRVNAVAPGPVWTPLVVYSFSKEHLEKFGKETPLGRAGYPCEIAPAYVFLASQDSSYITGQVVHVNGGEMVGG